MLISLSILKRPISPFMRLLIRGCVSPKKAAASVCVHPHRSIYCRKSSIKSARIFRFAASSAGNPTSSKTLPVPCVTCTFLPSLPLLSIVLGHLITLPAKLDVAFGRLLRLFLERVEYINGLLELCYVKNSVSLPSMNANFINTRTDRRHRSEVAWILSPLDRLQFKADFFRVSRGNWRTSSRDVPIHSSGLTPGTTFIYGFGSLGYSPFADKFDFWKSVGVMPD
jgi:hypothetical protein